jgi:hypothetical protein
MTSYPGTGGNFPNVPTLTPAMAASCAPQAIDRVGYVLQSLAGERTVSDAELEQHIRDCGVLMQRAHDNGNRQEAESWQAAMYAAIAARRPEVKARMEADIQRSIDEGVGFFCSDLALQMGRPA